MKSTKQDVKSNVQKESLLSKLGVGEQTRLINAREQDVYWKKWGLWSAKNPSAQPERVRRRAYGMIGTC